MINWLIEQTLVSTLLIVLLLLARKKLNQNIGAINAYKLWLIIPFSLILSNVNWPATEQIKVFEYTYVSELNNLYKINQSAAAEPIFIIWAFGVIGFIVFFVSSHIKTIKQFKLSPTTSPLNLPYPVKRLSYFRSTKVISPVVTGLLSNKLIIPHRFEQLYNREQQHLILEHELNHLSVKDLYWNLLALLTLILFWFNPISWLGYKRFRQQQELACDQQVLQNRTTNQKQEYARAMLVASIARQSNALTYLYYNEEIYMKERIKQGNNHESKSWKKIIPSLVCLTIFATAGQSVFAHNKEKSQTPTHREAPIYPKIAYENNVQGWVQLQFDVNTDGTVNNPKVTESSPDGVFDEAALNAIKKWHYSPADEKTINATAQINFKLEGSSKQKM